METIRVDEARLEPAATTLAAALLADPLGTYLVPDLEKRRKIIGPFMRANIRAGLLYGEVYSTAGGEGTAVWLRPGRTALDPLQLLRSGLLWATVRMGGGAMKRFFRFAALADRLHRESVTIPHWWLFVIGVDPACQRRGFGRALLEPMLARAESDAVPCYLETTNQRNLAYYESFGFGLTGQAQVSAAELTVWSMLRPSSRAA